MIISARERLILQYLIEQLEREVTIKDLADLIGVSERTIHRDLKNIDDIIRHFHLKLEKKSGVGIRITGSSEDIYQLKVSILKQNFIEYTPDERMIVALCNLLDSKEPVKLISLANELGVTTATISNDLDKLEPYIKEFNLQLVRRRGYGIELVGTEDSKRKVIRTLISERFDVQDFLKIIRENIQRKSTNKIDSISERLLGLIEKDKLIIIENIIDEINDLLPYSLADSSYVGLVVHLALAIERIQRGENITLKEKYLTELKASKEYQFAEEIASRLAQTFEINIPDEEKGYITMHLRGAKIRFEKEIGVQGENVETAYIVQQLIHQVEKITNVHLQNDRSLFQGLLAHLQPALYRLRQNMRISNPVLSEIKNDYSDLFYIIKQAVYDTFPNMEVPEEEIGYLVLHFGSALNNHKSLKRIKVLIICSSGIGTSKMLATKINAHIPNITELISVSAFELKNIELDDFDLILSTIPIELSKDYLLVSPILTKEELETIKSYLLKKGQQYISRTYSQKNEAKPYQLNYLEFKSFIKQSELLVELMESLDIYTTSEDTVEKMLRNVTRSLIEKGFISDTGANAVVDSLLQREKIGGLGIPGTSLALFHARNDHVLNPSINIIDLNKPKTISSMDSNNIEVKRIILLLAAEKADATVLELMSFVSALIIQSNESIQTFQNASKSMLIKYITNQFFNQFTQKQLEGM